MTQPSPFLTASEVAGRYDTTAETVRRWAREKKIPALVLPSGRVKFRRAEIDALIPAPDVAGPAGESSDDAAEVSPRASAASPASKSA